MKTLTVLILVGHLLLAAGLTYLGLVGVVMATWFDPYTTWLLYVSLFGPSILTLPSIALFTWVNKRKGGWKPYVTSAFVYAFSSLWLVYAWVYYGVQYLITGVW